MNEISHFSNYFEPEMFRLSLTMTSQSLVKHLLTEGDKLILSWFSPLQDQGGYAIAVNYGSPLPLCHLVANIYLQLGSLVARIVFQPIEEVSRVFFSKTLTRSPGESRESRRHALEQASKALSSMLAIQTSLTVILLVFGTSYMHLALHILLPPRYLSTSAPKVLSAWIWYIPVLSINGVLEAFLSSVATTQDLNRQSQYVATLNCPPHV
jgi:oligosaccharide translocation protein RFT1